MIGKLKHSLKERCPDCGKVLQLRVIEEEGFLDGILTIVPREVICCSNKSCGFERHVQQRKRKRTENLSM